jgi:hypothetical protein
VDTGSRGKSKKKYFYHTMPMLILGSNNNTSFFELKTLKNVLIPFLPVPDDDKNELANKIVGNRANCVFSACHNFRRTIDHLKRI